MNDERERKILKQVMADVEFSDEMSKSGAFLRLMQIRSEGIKVHNHDEDAMTDLTSLLGQRVEEDTADNPLTNQQYHALVGVFVMALDAAYVLGLKRGKQS